MLKRYLILGLLLAVLPGYSYAQSVNQMLEMQQQLTRLENEVRQLRGEVERLVHENKRLRNQQNDLYTDLDQRLRSLQEGQPANQLVVETIPPSATPSVSTPTTTNVTSVAPTNPSASVGATASLPPTQTATIQTPATGPVAAPADPAQEQAAYKEAFNLLKVGKYDEAILSYAEFLRQYPTGKYASNAQYWLGEANYVTRQFPVAIEEFRKVINNYPDSRKLPDAMLKIGYIHYELKQTDESRRVLTELTRKYPGSTASRLAENRLQRMKLEGR